MFIKSFPSFFKSISTFIIITLIILKGIFSAPAIAEEESEKKKNIRLRKILSKLDNSIKSATGYMVRNCNNNGRFTYLRHSEQNIDYGNKYNMLRHAGAIYSLCMSYNYKPSEEIKNTIKNAIKKLRKNVGEVTEKGDACAVWSDPSEPWSGRGSGLRQAKLGGAGLALIAMCSAKQICPESVDVDEMKNIGRFIVALQKRSGEFYSKYIEGKGVDSRFVSLYYPGEAMLGLMMLYKIDPDSLWLHSVTMGMTYLANIREGRVKVPVDHWALLATRSMIENWPDIKKNTSLYKRILIHAKQICNYALSQQIDIEGSPLSGGFNSEGRTCPTATRLEGLLASYTFMIEKEDAELRKDIKDSVINGMEFLLSSQLNKGENSGAITRAIKTKENSNGIDRNIRVGEIRIDYVQHALSAMIDFKSIFNK